MGNSISKKEILETLLTISNSARVIGAEGLVEDLKDLIKKIEQDL